MEFERLGVMGPKFLPYTSIVDPLWAHEQKWVFHISLKKTDSKIVELKKDNSHTNID